MSNRDFEVGGVAIRPGTRTRIELPIGRRVTGADVSLPLQVVRGLEDGPCIFLCAAVHGDEINGVEIIRRVLRTRGLKKMRGTLIAVPVVNLFGFIALSRYLPDRRDLNRSFPGSPSGSLAARLAHTFLNEVVAKSTHGIDLHTGAVHRSNFPQVRACLSHEDTRELALAFGVPVVIDANLRDGSLRQEVVDRGVPMLLYEGGEALRFDEEAIRAGTRGVLSVMRYLKMFPPKALPKTARARVEPFIARSSQWLRAPSAGILRGRARLGARVKKGSRLGIVSDPLGDGEVELRATRAGIVIGRSELPLVNEGDAVFHIASFEDPDQVADHVETFHGQMDDFLD